jgi:hypothetical protein
MRASSLTLVTILSAGTESIDCGIVLEGDMVLVVSDSDGTLRR